MLLSSYVQVLIICDFFSIGYVNIDGNSFTKLLMDGDYVSNYHDGDDWNDGNYNEGNDLNDGSYNDGDDSEDNNDDDSEDSIDDHDDDSDDSNNNSDNEFNQLITVACEASMIYFNKYIDKTPCRDSKQSGLIWVKRCLKGNKTLSYDMFRMKKHVFHRLCEILPNTYGFSQLRHLRLEESLAICLMILGHGSCNRLGVNFAADYIKPLDPTFSEIPDHIQDHPMYWPHFKVCVVMYI